MRLSIRWRLSLWNTAALAVALIAFAAAVYGEVRRDHYRRVDRLLRDQFDELARDPRYPGDADALREWIADAREDDKVSCVVYDPAGAVLMRTKELPEGDVPPAPRPAAEPSLGDAAWASQGRQRVLAGRLTSAGGEYAVLLAAPLREVDEELARLLTGFAVIVPFALAASCGFGYLLARRALAPVEGLRRRTEEITAARLDRRLPVANPHDELGRLAGTVNAMIARLERSFAEVRRFTADASHELRTPLTAIRLEAEIALKKPLGAAERDQLLGNILEECERLTRLTEQLLALAREDAGAVGGVREPLDLAELVRGVAETMRPLAEARGLKLTVGADGPLPVRGDPSRLRQVFYNLLDNSVKYTPDGGAVGVACGRREASAVVAVRDTGCGVAAEHLPHLFERFYRVDKARGRGGAGLGLSIAESIVAAHGGRIKLDSEPGRGTTVTVMLPVEPGE